MTKEQTEILREYLGICSRLWRWIGKNATANEFIEDTKHRWQEWECNGGTVKNMHHDCPCCEFDSVVGSGDCSRCPIEWTGGMCIGVSGESEYDGACDAITQRSKRMWANRIARLAEEALARLEAQ